MPSNALARWQSDRLFRLNLIDAQCVAVAGLPVPNPQLADELLRGYTMLLSANLQGFCRDLHSECVQNVAVVAATLPRMGMIQAMGDANLHLDQGNPNWGAIIADFDRFGFSLKQTIIARAKAAGAAAETTLKTRLRAVSCLNEWRNYCAHHNLTQPRGHGTFDLATVSGWKIACDGFAADLDDVMHGQLLALGAHPW